MERHDQTVAWFGVTLPPCTPELRTAADAHAKERQERYRQAHGSNRTYDKRGGKYEETSADGLIAAELFANSFHTSADWRHHPFGDPGWDVRLLNDWGVNTKLRQGLLTLNDDELSCEADYFALVEQRTTTSSYIFCGVIRPIDFRRSRVPIQLRHNALWTVPTETLITPAVFHHKLREPRR
jgi:hypothetical protein